MLHRHRWGVTALLFSLTLWVPISFFGVDITERYWAGFVMGVMAQTVLMMTWRSHEDL